jgi:hypothetical protein
MRRLVLAILAILLASGTAWAQATMRPAERRSWQGKAIPEARIDLPVDITVGIVRVRAEASLADRAIATAERADAELEAIRSDLVGLPAPEVVEIRLVEEADDMALAAPPDAPPPRWAAGVAYPSSGLVIVAQWRGAQRLDLDGTVDHELAHLALGAALGPRAPRWLHEGFAYLHSTDWSWERSQTLAGMAWFGNTIPLDELEAGFPAEELPASRAYAQSYDFVAFLARRGQWQDEGDDGDRFAFRQFLAYAAETDDLDEAAMRAYGRPLADLFEEWRADMKQRFMFLPIGLFLLSLWLIAALLLVLGWRRRRRQNAARLAEWERIEREARERAREQDGSGPRLVPAVPVWSGPFWAPPGASVSEPPEDDVDAVLEDDDDGSPRPPPPPRRPPRVLN